MAKETNTAILIVDSIKVVRDLLKGTLKQLGFRAIDEAENGKRAMQMLREEDFDLVITDLRMPDMTGLDLLKEIKGDNTLKHIPVVILTSEAKKEYILESIRAGASDYILKPFTLEDVRKRLGAIVKLNAESETKGSVPKKKPFLS
ncbi:MAG: response regulator [Pseudomonadota bacterium]